MWPRQQPGRESCQVVLLTPLLLPSWARVELDTFAAAAPRGPTLTPHSFSSRSHNAHTHTHNKACALAFVLLLHPAGLL